MAVAVAWTMPNAFISGVVLGACLVAIPGALWVTTIQATGTASRMMGDDAEQWTSGELHRLVRRGWQLVNHVRLTGSDTDHILLGPGGAYAIETKWSGSWDGDYGRQRLGKAVAQARDNARRLALWYPFKRLGIAPEPVVVLWGGGLSATSPRRVVGGVTVVTGRGGLKEWAAGMDRRVLSDNQIDDGWSALESQVSRRDPVEMEKHPLPPSVAEMVARAGLGIGAGAFALVAFGETLSRTRSVAVTATSACLLLCPSYFLRHSPTWKWAAYTWSGGLALPAIALLLEAAIR